MLQVISSGELRLHLINLATNLGELHQSSVKNAGLHSAMNRNPVTARTPYENVAHGRDGDSTERRETPNKECGKYGEEERCQMI